MATRTVTPLPPETVDTNCSQCKTERDHRVLKGKVVKGGLGVEGTFACLTCDHVHSGLVTFPEPMEIPIIISRDAEAEPYSVQVFADDDVMVGDEFEIEEDLVEVTAIELKDQHRRVQRAPVGEIHTLWAKSIREVKVPFAINMGQVTRGFESVFGPEDEVACGDKFDLDGSDVIVDKIITDEGKRYRGSFNVREIKRVWLRRPGPRREERTSARGGRTENAPPRRGRGRGPGGTGRPASPRAGQRGERTGGRGSGPGRSGSGGGYGGGPGGPRGGGSRGGPRGGR